MSLKHAMLGFLNYGPRSGYDLKGIFDNSVNHFWPADQSQIYRSLADMAEQGWIEQELIRQEGRPDRKLYHITNEGYEELQRWLTTPVAHKPHRSAPLVQVFFAGQLADEEILLMFERVAEQLRGMLDVYQQIPAQIEPYSEQVASPRETFFWFLTLESGMELARCQLAWIEDVIERIKQGNYTNRLGESDPERT